MAAEPGTAIVIGLGLSLTAGAAGVVLLLGAVLWHACAPLAYAGRHEATGRHRAVVQRSSAVAAAPSTFHPAYTGGTP